MLLGHPVCIRNEPGPGGQGRLAQVDDTFSCSVASSPSLEIFSRETRESHNPFFAPSLEGSHYYSSSQSSRNPFSSSGVLSASMSQLWSHKYLHRAK